MKYINMSLLICLLGPTRAVKLLLGFKADFKMRNKAGKLPSEIAEQHGKRDSYRLLQSWGSIRRALVHVDFSLVWRKFLNDYEAVISNAKTAEAIILEIDMEENLRKLERDGKDILAIDDPMLRQVYYENRDFALKGMYVCVCVCLFVCLFVCLLCMYVCMYVQNVC